MLELVRRGLIDATQNNDFEDIELESLKKEKYMNLESKIEAFYF